MELQSLVIGSDDIELSMGRRDGGREYLFVRLPNIDPDLASRTLNEVNFSILSRVRDAVDHHLQLLAQKPPVS